ncbi:hypothetical protein A0J61_01145 [Choanephora cucurbitarum]|uniref:Uncharacterized protein n=1 Tax=Choanephora cucurbitarum TaxID=101091 RepID=A0A1C7NP74_9FUNG|nr:hypothetical protein A0J61_01145 [Choanephora cucurbitarum]
MSIRFEIEGQGARIITPPLLNKKITLGSSDNTSRWVFYGTRPQILEWIENHQDIQLENNLFSQGRPLTYQTHTEVVIDLQSYSDPDQSLFSYLSSFVATDFIHEKVKVEIRPRVESKDQLISHLCRIVVASGVRLGDILTELNRIWYQPSPSFIEQANDLINDQPRPIHILSTDAPMHIQVD